MSIDVNLVGNTRPFLKWAGGKRWFVASYKSMMPKRFGRYFEPFLGSGALFFYLTPHDAVLGDSNLDLIDTYRAIKEEWLLVEQYLHEHQLKHSKSYYYSIRCSTPQSIASRAARFIYLNRTCWNGLYRVNRAGSFNVPIGTRSSIVRDDDDFAMVSAALQTAELHHSDFEDLIDMASTGDLVFIDPPYTVRHNHNSFIKYNEKLFSWSDQERLFFSLKRAKDRGVQIIGTNACHDSIKKLYGSAFDIHEVSRSSTISGDPRFRKRAKELVFLNGGGA